MKNTSIKWDLFNQKDDPIEKLKDLFLSFDSVSIGKAYEKDNGPIAVRTSKEIPVEDLILILLSVA